MLRRLIARRRVERRVRQLGARPVLDDGRPRHRFVQQVRRRGELRRAERRVGLCWQGTDARLLGQRICVSAVST